MTKLIAIALAALFAVSTSAFAEEFTYEGTVLAPNPGGTDGFSASELAYTQAGIELSGIDAVRIDLPANLENFDLIGDAGVIGACDLDIKFYDANGGSTGIVGDFFTEYCGEFGQVPVGSAYAFVVLWAGFNVNFTFSAE